MSRNTRKNKTPKEVIQESSTQSPANGDGLNKKDDTNGGDSSINKKPYKWITADRVIDVMQLVGTLLLFWIATAQNDAAEKSADAAIEAVAAVKDQFEIANRPFLTLKTDAISVTFSKGEKGELRYFVINKGVYPTVITKEKGVFDFYDGSYSKKDILEGILKKMKAKEELILHYYVTSEPCLMVTKTSEIFTDDFFKFISDEQTRIAFGSELTYQDRISNKFFKYSFVILKKNNDQNYVDVIYQNVDEVK